MTITVQSEGNLSTSATVYDALGTVVASTVLINWEGGLYRAQVPVAVPGVAYTVQLRVQDANYSDSSGNYAAGIDFVQPLATSVTVAAGAVTNNSQTLVGIDVQESGTFRFNLSAASMNTNAVNWMNVYVYNATGTVVAMVGTDGQGSTDTLTAFLKKGKYSIQMVPIYTNSSSAAINFGLKLARLSDPIDAYPPGPYCPAPPAAARGRRHPRRHHRPAI